MLRGTLEEPRPASKKPQTVVADQGDEKETGWLLRQQKPGRPPGCLEVNAGAVGGLIPSAPRRVG